MTQLSSEAISYRKYLPVLGTTMAYVDAGHAQPGTSLHVDVRGRQHAAHVVQRPFYRRGR